MWCLLPLPSPAPLYFSFSPSSSFMSIFICILVHLSPPPPPPSFSLLHLPLSVLASSLLPLLSQFVLLSLLVPNPPPSQFITFVSHRYRLYLLLYSSGYLPLQLGSVSSISTCSLVPFSSLSCFLPFCCLTQPLPPPFPPDFSLPSQFLVSCPGIIYPTSMLLHFKMMYMYLSPPAPSPRRLIHSPSFTMIVFSSVMFLAEGRTAYMGSTAEAIPYFQRCTFNT